MHDHNKPQSDSKNPYIQIMFNINSKNVVNNNILSDKRKDLNLQLPHQLKPQKIDKTFIFPEKKGINEIKHKAQRANCNKSSISNYRVEDLSSSQNKKNKKNSTKASKINFQASDTQRQTKHVKHKKKTSEGIVRPSTPQQGQASQKKNLIKSKQTQKTNKDVRQKIIQMMIKDYQKGNISGKNFKDAISSLIQKQASNKKVSNKSYTQIKTQKSKTYCTNSQKNSLGTSLRNTPRHKPSKSKSQKFYHDQKSSNLKQGHISEQEQRSPQIIQRVIDRKQFVNKIIIKGINSSLFLSNEFTQKQSPKKREPIQMTVINTSDSVRQLKVKMQKSIKTSNVIKSQKGRQVQLGRQSLSGRANQKMFKKDKNSSKHADNIQTISVVKIQKAWRNYRTKRILSRIMAQIQYQQQNNHLTQSRLRFSDTKEQSYSKYASVQSHNLAHYQENQFSHKPISFQITKTPLKQSKELLDQFYIREDVDSHSQNYSKIQELQKEYALILKDSNQSKYLSSKEQSYRDTFSSVQKYRLQQNINSKLQYGSDQAENQEKIKSYVSSELEMISSQKKNQLYEARKQETNQKRAKCIQNGQIKKLTQIIDVVKQQMTKGQTDPKQASHDLILQKIVSLLENQKNSFQGELKIYSQFSQKHKPLEEKFLHKQEQSFDGEIVNTWRKNDKKGKISNIFKANQRLKFDQPASNIHIVAESSLHSFNSQSSVTLSHRSIYSTSSTYSNHLQKAKISQLNLDYIEIGLNKRLNELEVKKEVQMGLITEKFINDKISPRQYQEEKQIIDKWFKIEAGQLKKTKNRLVEGYRKAKQFLMRDQVGYESRLSKEKSLKMIKCISEKYLQRKQTDKLDKFQQFKQQEQQYLPLVRKQQLVNKQKRNVKNQDSSQINRYKNEQKSQVPTKTKKQQNIKAKYLPPLILPSSSLQKNTSPLQQAIEQLQNQLLNNIGKQETRIKILQKPSDRKQFNCQPQRTNLRKTSKQNGEQTIENFSGSHGESKMIMSIKYGVAQYNEEQNQIHSRQNEETNDQQPLTETQMAEIHTGIEKFLQRYEQENDQNDMQGQQQGESQQDNQDQEQEDNSYENDDDEVQQLYQGQLSYYSDEDDESQSDGDHISFNSFFQQSIKMTTNQQIPSSKEQTQHLNVIINKKSPTSFPLSSSNFPSQELIFSPKKPQMREQFSQQLPQYQPASLSPSYQKSSTQDIDNTLNQNLKQFKYLTEQDKDDIFEFMFLDLCLEIFLQQTKNNTVMKSIETYLVNQRRRKNMAKGFKTGLFICRGYVENFIQYVKSNYFPILKRLQSPMGPSAKQMLRFMRDYDDQSSQQNSQVEAINLILPIQTYETYQTLPINKLILQRYYQDDQKQQSRLKFLNSLKHFHNKAIFDSLNQSLDLERNYGIWGKPFPWKTSLCLDRAFTQAEIKVLLDDYCQRKLSDSKDKVIQHCSYLCGVLVDKEQSVFGKANVSEEYLHHIREDRMSKMLSNQMLDNEDRWTFYDDEQTQVLITITKYVTNKLISQLLSEIYQIQQKNT